MKKKLVYAVLGVLFLLALTAHARLERLTRPAQPPAEPRRIVSLAPSITETLYALGMGDSVVGVTRFCAYPPEVKDKPRVAGFSDINYEAILRLRPDLVVLPSDKVPQRIDLERMGLPVLTLDTRTLGGYMEDVSLLGAQTGKREEARRILSDLRGSLAEARTRAAGETPPSVLFAVMHSYEGLGQITEIYAVGRDGFYDELIESAGGVNVCASNMDFPRLSREAIIFLDPEVIIDVIPTKETDLDAVRRDWRSLDSVKAVRNGRLHLLTDEGDTVPGPRSHLTVEKLSRAFYPGKP